MANAYFLIMFFLELVPGIGTQGGAATTIMPLTIIVGLSMLKDAFEDRKRRKQDDAENQRICNVIPRGEDQMQDARTEDIQVGCIVKVKENEFFPCDMYLLNTSSPKGICFVETKNLDGETNLKHKQAAK